MPYDYYAFKRTALSDSMNALESAVENKDIKKAARRIAQIEPHLAFLLFESHGGADLGIKVRDAWSENLTVGTIPPLLHLIPDLAGIVQLPSLSFALRIPFRLAKPYLSKDERDFYLLDAPLRKEKVFQTPMVASTSWKGALRAALWQQGHVETDAVTLRLFGNPRGSEELQAGRLHFYPTFFQKMSLEVINPHERSTGVGRRRGPILMECVPEGESGDLFLLYVPFGMGEQDEAAQRAFVAEDLEIVAAGVQAMLITYGFGAKTSSGYGTARDQLAGEGHLVLRASLAEVVSAATPAPLAQTPPDLPRYLESPRALNADFRQQDGTLKPEAEYQALIESRGQKYTKKDKLLYEKAKGWWEREGRATINATPEPSEPEPTVKPTPPLIECGFGALSELCAVAQELARLLREGGIA